MPTGWEIVGSEPVPVEGGWDVKGSEPIGTGHPLTFGNTLAGLGEMAASAVGNIPHGAAHAGVDLYRRLTGGDTNAPDPAIVRAIQVPQGEAAQNLAAGVSELPAAQAVGGAVQSADQALGRFSPVAQDIVHEGLGVAGDVANLAPLAGIGKAFASTAADAAAHTAATAPEWARAGFENGENHPIARVLAGGSGKDALTLHNQQVGNAINGQEAGVAPGVRLGYENLAAARAAPNSVYDRVARALPTGQLDAGAQQALSGIGGDLTNETTANQLARMKQNVVSAPDGQGLVNQLRSMRQEGFARIGSDDVDNQQLGHAQLGIARAIEDHIGRNLPANGDVNVEQFQDARKALAKNFAVQGALRGDHVDLGTIARLQRADPQLLTDGLKVSADFANQNPAVTGLGSRIYEPPSYGQDIMGIPGTHRLENFLSPSFWSGAAGGTALARRVLTGDTGKAVAGARQAFPGTLGAEFGPLEPGMTHPQPFPHDTGGLELAQNGPISPPSAPQGGIPLADVLSHGVEQAPPAGLSLADDLGAGGRPGQGIPFRPNLEHAAGGLELAPEPGVAPRENLGDLAAVASQGVPEGIVARSSSAFKPRKRDTKNFTPDLGTILGGGPRGE